MNKRKRTSIKPSVSKALIASSGGRCCFRKNGRRCKKLLVSGRKAIGKQAHIIGVNGARSEISMPFKYKGIIIEEINDFHNLLWVCGDHHDEIDDLCNEDIYTVERLINMKLEHELETAHKCSFPLDERDRADAWFIYSFFSSFDIGVLYSLDFDDAYGDSDDNILLFISTLSFVLDELGCNSSIFKNRALGRKWRAFAQDFLTVFPNELLIDQEPNKQDVEEFLDSRDAFLELVERRYCWVREILVGDESSWL